MDSIARANTVAFDPFVPNRILLGGDSIYNYKLLLVSSDLGTSWEHTGNGLSGIVYCLVPSVRTPGLFYAGTNQGLFRSTDGGVNWSRTGTFTMVRAVVIDNQNDSLIYAGTSSGVYMSTDAGVSWQAVNEGLVIPDILSLAFRSNAPRTVFAGTNGSGAYFTTPPTGVDELAGSVEVEPIQVQVLPNPARTRFSLTVASPAGQTVQAVIYEPSGRLIRQLPPRLSSGNTVSWLLDWRGAGRGVYFIRIKAGAVEQRARVVITD